MKIAKVLRVAALLLSVFCTIPAYADSAPIEAYGELPGIEDVAISYNGRNIAIIGRVEGQRQLVVLDGERKVLATIPARDAKVRDIRWIGDEAVMLGISVTEALTEVFSADKAEIFGTLIVPLDGTKPWMVFDKSQDMSNATFGSHGTRRIGDKWLGYFEGLQLARTSAARSLFGSEYMLFAVDLKSSATTRIAHSAASGMRRSWLIDGDGKVAAIFEISAKTGRWQISNAKGDGLASGTDPTGDVALVSLGRDGTSLVYSTEDDASGENRLYEVPLAGGAPTEILADVDIERIYRDPTNGRMLGYLERGNPPRPVLFDPAKQAVIRKVFKAFSKLHVTIEGWTPDFSHVLVNTSGNGDSGTWYIVDMAKLSADAVGYERPLILPERVGPVSTFAYRAADGLELDGILTLPPGREAKNLPVVMFPHGGPASHDEAQFDWWAQAFASRGYAVFQPNFRGSTNRGDAFRRAGYGEWGRKMQTDISDGLAELAKRGIVDPRRACIMGGSYGGYASLAGVTLQQGLYRCAVSVAGVSDIKALYAENVRETGQNKMVWRGMRESWGQPATFDAVSPRRNAARADAPVMLIHGKDDVVVPYDQSTEMLQALRAAGKPVELVTLREEDHWLSRSTTRKQMLEAAMRFVQQHNPAD